MAGTDNFYFSDFSADYYLSRDEEGISHLKVVENLTAVFPEYRQNKGICRKISTTNQDGANVTLDFNAQNNIRVLRNGVREPIWSTELYSDHYEVCTGTDDYVLGENVYTLEYEFEKVVTDFGDYQELYWDTNGNGWSQRFDKVTANLHFVGMVADDYQDLSWCYVGKYGESGQERCEITKTEDGVSFTAENLQAGENLTFDVQFDPGSFVVPKPELNYNSVWMFLLTVVLCGMFLVFPIRKYLKARPKMKYYKEKFVKPEYQPSKKYDISEMTEIYLGKKHDVKVGILLDLIVRKKISLKDLKVVRVNTLDGVSEPAKYLLKILSDNESVEPGSEFEIKQRSASAKLASLASKFDKSIKDKLKADKLVEKGYNLTDAASSDSVKDATVVFVLIAIILGWFGYMGMSVFFMILDEFCDLGLGLVGMRRGVLLFGDWYFIVLAGVVLAAFYVWFVISGKARKYAGLTTLGLDQSNYMEGLKLYIKMAEAKRLELLQSVKGADVSPEGVVKLYEKLLPYAAVFGLEKSWMRQMEEYCRVQDVAEPDWVTTGVTMAQISRFANTASSYATSSSTYVSGGGGSSSGFSGGGGGGFSGGGGGGGGGGGR